MLYLVIQMKQCPLSKPPGNIPNIFYRICSGGWHLQIYKCLFCPGATMKILAMTSLEYYIYLLRIESRVNSGQ